MRISHLRSLIAQAHDLLRDGSPSGPDGYSSHARDLEGAAGSMMPDFRELYRDEVSEARALVEDLYGAAEREASAIAAELGAPQ